MSESNACLSKSDMEASPPGTLWLIHSKVIPMQLQSFMVRAVFYLILLCSSSLFHLPTALLLPQWLWSSQGAKFVASILGYFLKDGSRGWYWQNTSRGWDIVTNDNLANALWKTVGGPHFPEGTQGIKYQWIVHTYGRARIWDDVVGPQCQEAQHCHFLSCLLSSDISSDEPVSQNLVPFLSFLLWNHHVHSYAWANTLISSTV